MALFANEAFFADAGLLLSGLGALAYALHRLFLQNWLRNAASVVLGLAACSLTLSLVIRSITAQFIALSNMYEALLISVLALITAFLLIERRFHVTNLGWSVCLLALIAMFYAGSLPMEINPLQAALRSYWRSLHVPPLLLSYGLFTLSFLSSIALLLARLGKAGAGPTPEAKATRDGEGGVMTLSWNRAANLYDEITYRCIAAGFPLLMIGVVLGAVWANEAWGSYWSWDPKESMSLVTLLAYGIYLHMRIHGEHSQRSLAWVSIAGFLLMLMTFIGVNLWGFGSLHSYGSIP